MEFKELVLNRRSIRQYTDRKVSSEELDYIMTAAVNAPSACNMQSWHFYVVSDPAVKEGFKEFCADWISSAPIVIVICTAGNEIVSRFGEKAKKFIIQDTALAMQNMLLAAADIGLGGCIIGAYDDDKCRKLLNIPDEYSPVALMPIGEPVIIPPARDRKPMSEVVTYVGDIPNVQESAQKEPKPFELKTAWLPNAVFDDLGMPNATFNNINLSDAKFTDINLSGASFGDINLKNSSFGGLTMEDASFGCVMLNGAKFKNVEFKNAQFEECDFDGATLDGVNICDAVEEYKNQ